MPSTFAIPNGASSSVGVCITGLQRNLLEPPVVLAFDRHVRRPLAPASVDVHLAIVVSQPTEAHTTLRKSIAHAYTPMRLLLLSKNATESWSRSGGRRRSNSTSCRVNSKPTWPNGEGDLSVLRQWVAIGACYRLIEASERALDRAYGWLLRLRTDLVYFADVPLPSQLSPSFAYVSSNGMTGDPMYRCMNDQVFVCPRRLCGAYFQLLELWSSPYCNGTTRSPSGTSGSIFATSDVEPNELPNSPFLMPQPPPERSRPAMSAQWYMFARYTRAPGRPCTATDETRACCGLLREVAWPYSISRARGQLECGFRLSSYPARSPVDEDFGKRPNFGNASSLYLAACRTAQAAWRRQPRRGHSHHPPATVVSIASTDGYKTPWLRLADRWRVELPEVGRATERAPAAVVLGSMLDLKTSPYLMSGHLRKPNVTLHSSLAARLNYTKEAVFRAIDAFAAASATRRLLSDGKLELHVVHELNEVPSVMHYRQGVTLHRLGAPVTTSRGYSVPAQDARWAAYEQVRARMRFGRGACTFSVDLSDVRVLNDLRTLCEQHGPSTLFASTDTCHASSPGRKLLVRQIREMGLHVSKELWDSLRSDADADDDLKALPRIVSNCGIFGARSGLFWKTVRALAASTLAHYDVTATETLPLNVIDMVMVNDLLATHVGPVVRGWPFGPVNVPFWGESCASSSTFCKNGGYVRNSLALAGLRRTVLDHSVRHGFLPAPNLSHETGPCTIKDMLAEMQTRMFFAHKLGCGKTIRC
jgi:hypothetical protein